MINTIIETFRRQAREHKTIKAFMYGRNYEKGSGKDRYPLFWLEDPMTGRNQDNTFLNTVNFSVLFIPSKDQKAEHLQALAFSIGLNIIERIKADKQALISVSPNWTYLTLSDYYDDSACGCRFTVNFVQRNMQDLCLIDEQFDTEKEFEVQERFADFELSGSDTCEVFSGKLPDFNLKTKKR